MAGANDLGLLPCAMLDRDKIRLEIGVIRQRTTAPLNVNFFCYTPRESYSQHQEAWKARLRTYYEELELDPNAEAPSVKEPYDAATCETVEDLKPEIVSFISAFRINRCSTVKAAGRKVICSATTSAEAEWSRNGAATQHCARVEAGGHRGIFLSEDVFALAGRWRSCCRWSMVCVR